MRRTTIRLNDYVLIEIKKLAAETGRSLTAVIEDSLRETLSRRQRRETAEPVSLTTCSGRGPQPGVDLDDTASLLSRMERDTAPSRKRP
ncbi:MAG: ribbon-helix-helix protein, CopG family [Planctomycetota bacterium]|jgi:hypothetical protein